MVEIDRSRIAVYLAYASQSMGQAMAWQFITFFAKHDLGESSHLVLAFVWAIPAFVTMIAVYLWGSLSDRVGRRKPFMVVGFIGYTYTFFLYSLVTDVFQFVLVAMAGAACSAAAIPAGQAYLTTKTAKKGQRLGFYMVVTSAGWFFGALASGLLHDMIGMFTMFRISAAICIVAVGVSAVLVKDLPIVQPTVHTKVRFRDMIRKPGMARLALMVTLNTVGIYATSFVMAIVVVDELGGPAAYVGYANSGATLAAVLITGFIGILADRHGAVPIMFTAYVSYSLYAIGWGLVTDPLLATVLYMLPIYALAQTGSYAFVARISADAERGSAMGIVNGAQNAGNALGPIVGGLFAEFIFLRFQPVAWVTLVFNLAAMIVCATLFRVEKQARYREETALGQPTASGLAFPDEGLLNDNASP
jgi:MFS family permease